MHKKSVGMLQYAREVANLEKRIEVGEVRSKEEIDAQRWKIFSDAAPKMSENELLRIRARALAGHGVLSKILADKGYPVPGNDPNKPN
jgi:hypothetical protein